MVFYRSVPLDVQLRVENKRDVDRAVFVDLRSGVKDVAGKIIVLARAYNAGRGRHNGRYKLPRAQGGSGVLRRRLKELAQWYGVPYLEERLYSTVCPKRDAKVVEERGRVMRCPTCGFSNYRDRIPLLRTKRRCRELLRETKQPAFSPSRQSSYF